MIQTHSTIPADTGLRRSSRRRTTSSVPLKITDTCNCSSSLLSRMDIDTRGINNRRRCGITEFCTNPSSGGSKWVERTHLDPEDDYAVDWSQDRYEMMKLLSLMDIEQQMYSIDSDTSRDGDEMSENVSEELTTQPKKHMDAEESSECMEEVEGLDDTLFSQSKQDDVTQPTVRDHGQTSPEGEEEMKDDTARKQGSGAKYHSQDAMRPIISSPRVYQSSYRIPNNNRGAKELSPSSTNIQQVMVTVTPVSITKVVRVQPQQAIQREVIVITSSDDDDDNNDNDNGGQDKTDTDSTQTIGSEDDTESSSSSEWVDDGDASSEDDDDDSSDGYGETNHDDGDRDDANIEYIGDYDDDDDDDDDGEYNLLYAGVNRLAISTPTSASTSNVKTSSKTKENNVISMFYQSCKQRPGTPHPNKFKQTKPSRNKRSRKDDEAADEPTALSSSVATISSEHDQYLPLMRPKKRLRSTRE